MRKCYTRPCNFYYGNYAKRLIAKKKGLPLAGNPNIAFDQLEIFQRKGKKATKSDFYSIDKIEELNKTILSTIRTDLKKNNLKKKKFFRFEI